MMVDQFTKWVECVPLPSQKAEVTARAAIDDFFRDLVVLCSYSQIKDGTLRASYLKHYVMGSRSTRQEQLHIGPLLMAKVSDLTERLWTLFGVF